MAEVSKIKLPGATTPHTIKDTYGRQHIAYGVTHSSSTSTAYKVYIAEFDGNPNKITDYQNGIAIAVKFAIQNTAYASGVTLQLCDNSGIALKNTDGTTLTAKPIYLDGVKITSAGKLKVNHVYIFIYDTTLGGWVGSEGIQGATGVKGEPGKSIRPMGQWISGTTYLYLDIVCAGKGTYMCKNTNGTTSSPLTVFIDVFGNLMQYKDGNYVLADDQTVNTDWIELSRNGDTGATGAQGVTGPQGPQGIKGTKGDRGDTGIQGVTGSQGIQGIQGVTGPKGDTGTTGYTGPQGIQGPKGDTGSQGVTGLQGIQGPKGEQGVTGPKGNTGAQGPQGVTGARGTNGARGATGPQGVTGPKGNTGAQGPQGVTGAQGPIGPAGSGGAGSGNMWRGILDGDIVELTKIWDTWDTGEKLSSILQIRVPSITTLESIYSTATFDCLEMASGNWNLGEYKTVDVPFIRFYIGAKISDSFISCTAHVKFDASCTLSLTQDDNVDTIDAEISFNYTRGGERIYVSAFLKSSKGTAYYML